MFIEQFGICFGSTPSGSYVLIEIIAINIRALRVLLMKLIYGENILTSPTLYQSRRDLMFIEQHGICFGSTPSGSYVLIEIVAINIRTLRVLSRKLIFGENILTSPTLYQSRRDLMFIEQFDSYCGSTPAGSHVNNCIKQK